MTKEIDYLNEDDPILGQSWVCMSFISPEGVRNCKIRGLKVRGVFSSKDEADQHAKDLQEIDPDFHVFVGEVGKWLPQDPDPNSISDQQYREKELNRLMKDYKTNLVKAKAMESERKDDMLQDAIRSERDRKGRVKGRLQRKLQEKQARKEIEEFKTAAPTQLTEEKKLKQAETTKLLEEKQKIASTEQTRIEGNKQQVAKSEETISKIDENINKIQDLYNSLVKKRQEKTSAVSVQPTENAKTD